MHKFIAGGNLSAPQMFLALFLSRAVDESDRCLMDYAVAHLGWHPRPDEATPFLLPASLLVVADEIVVDFNVEGSWGCPTSLCRDSSVFISDFEGPTC